MQPQGLRLGIEPATSRPTLYRLSYRSRWRELRREFCIYIDGNAGEVQGYIKDNIWHLRQKDIHFYIVRKYLSDIYIYNYIRKKLFTASGKPKSAFSIHGKQSSHVCHGCGDEATCMAGLCR